LDEALFILFIGSEMRREKLQHNDAVELGVLSFLDDAHAALAEFFKNLVVRNSLSDH